MQCPRTNRCLHWSNVCDGVGDCKNAEDEDKNICGVTFCASGSFQCQSGSCIGKDRLCDHNADCFDGSDEMPAICRQKTGSKAVEWFTKSCALVPKQGMRVTDYFSQLSYKQDAQVPDQSIVEITCDDGYRLFGSNINSCDNGAWENNLISCVRYCEPSPYSRSIAYSTKCSDVGDCNEGSLMDTEMLVSCAPGYESDSADNLVGHHVCDENGEWTVVEANPICTPICGVKSPHHPGITPWTVSLFQRTLPGDVIYTFKCMGTILSPFIVITADACFSEAAEAYSPLFFKVVEGDHKIEFREDEDHGYTLHNLMEIHIVT
ncbi:very low-density lipoprotein receptor-like [Drosophila navojoa]|nr:very low-density lipoprotein receptor-like [Drosophila navojoa]